MNNTYTVMPVENDAVYELRRRITELQHALRIAEGYIVNLDARNARLERALRELAAIVGNEAWSRVMDILTGGEEDGNVWPRIDEREGSDE